VRRVPRGRGVVLRKMRGENYPERKTILPDLLVGKCRRTAMRELSIRARRTPRRGELPRESRARARDRDFEIQIFRATRDESCRNSRALNHAEKLFRRARRHFRPAPQKKIAVARFQSVRIAREIRRAEIKFATRELAHSNQKYSTTSEIVSLRANSKFGKCVQNYTGFRREKQNNFARRRCRIHRDHFNRMRENT